MLRADAGAAASYASATPAEIVLWCGVFGNISTADIRASVAAIPELCSPGAVVIWTRHRRSPDLTSSIRDWFEAAGFVEIAFDAPAEEYVGVGVHRLVAEPKPFNAGRSFFTFTR